MSTDDMNTPTTTDDNAVPLLDRNLYRTIKKWIVTPWRACSMTSSSAVGRKDLLKLA